MFSQAEVNLMEKQLLYLMDYELGITEDELIQRKHCMSSTRDLY
jgi:G1/S-specific cyclin PLC1